MRGTPFLIQPFVGEAFVGQCLLALGLRKRGAPVSVLHDVAAAVPHSESFGSRYTISSK
jgi:hypothetical protein